MNYESLCNLYRKTSIFGPRTKAHFFEFSFFDLHFGQNRIFAKIVHKVAHKVSLCSNFRKNSILD